jgi:anti-sigma B factor antagonist
MSFEVRESAGFPVVVGPAEIDISNSGQLRAALLHAQALSPVVVVDLSGTEFCDSSGLSVLVRALRRAQAEGGEVRLVVCTAAVLRILAVTGIGSIFGLFPSLADALAKPSSGLTQQADTVP